MQDKSLEEAVKMLEDRGWQISTDGEWSYFDWYTPAGEDYGFDTKAIESLEDLHLEFMSEFTRFDVDDHVDLWAPWRGQKGVPDSYGVLIEDAERINEELSECEIILYGMVEESRMAKLEEAEEGDFETSDLT